MKEIPQVHLAPTSSRTGQAVQPRTRPATNIDLARAPVLEGGAVRPASVALVAGIVVGQVVDCSVAVGYERAPAGRLAFEMTRVTRPVAGV